MNDCVFCKLVQTYKNEPTKSKLVERYPKANQFRFTPLNPVVPGHMLFIAALHTRDAADNPDLTGHIFEYAADYAQQQLQPFNLITSAGKDATQSIHHTHVHYVPRKTNDGLLLPWSNQIKE